MHPSPRPSGDVPELFSHRNPVRKNRQTLWWTLRAAARLAGNCGGGMCGVRRAERVGQDYAAADRGAALAAFGRHGELSEWQRREKRDTAGGRICGTRNDGV